MRDAKEVVNEMKTVSDILKDIANEKKRDLIYTLNSQEIVLLEKYIKKYNVPYEMIEKNEETATIKILTNGIKYKTC